MSCHDLHVFVLQHHLGAATEINVLGIIGVYRDSADSKCPDTQQSLSQRLHSARP